MTIPEWIDEYINLRNPESAEQFGKMVRRVLFEQIGGDTDEDLAERIQQIEVDRARAEEEWLAGFDTGILDALRLTVVDLQAMLADRRRKALGGRTRIVISTDRKKVFMSFIESERMGRTFAEAVIAAKSTAPTISEKSIRNWLADTIRLGVNKTPAATRAKRALSNGKS